MTPKGLLNIHCQAMAITAVGSAQGTSTPSRNRALPRKGLWTNSAIRSPRPNSNGTERPVKTRVFFTVILRS